jgi:hypothetical protein
LNAWSHVAVVRSGTTISIYLNGVSSASATVSQAIGTTGAFSFGRQSDGSGYYYNGYFSNIRIVKGTAVYTGNFTPPTAPLTATTNTSLLLSCTNGLIYDNSMMANLLTGGTAQISTGVVKYGTGSVFFNGTSDYLSQTITSRTLNSDFGTGDFTVELWANYNSTVQQRYSTFVSYGGFTNSGSNRAGWSICLDTTNTIIYVTIATLNYSWPFNPTTYGSNWFHLAVVRNNGSLQVYVNGTALGAAQTASGSASQDANAWNLYIGGGANLGANQYFSGFIDELRFTKGYARYTSNFTAPTSQFSNTGPIPIPTSNVEYLVVGGGGGGGTAIFGQNATGGGGGGGLLTGTTGVLAGTSYTVTVGAGGAVAANNSSQPTNGLNSVFGSFATAIGGGYGANRDTGGNGNSGGSGGGGNSYGSAGGAGTTGQGNSGGNGFGNVGGTGGGGGAGSVGGTTVTTNGGNAGNGVASSISGTSVYYAGGGAGGGDSGNGSAGSQGGTAATSAGAVNTGAGAGSKASSGGGGSGVVILRYPSGFSLATSTTGSPSVSITGGYNIYTWTSSGSITF